jgi:hypothetical protein
MKRVLSALSFLLFLLIIFSCEEDVNRPVIKTIDVSDLTTEGVTLNGKLIVSAGQEISDYGFVWSINTDPSISPASFSFSYNEKPPVGSFQHRVTDDLVKGTQYFARTFIKINSQLIYGNTIKFIAQGSATPVILSFSPKSGGSLDEVVLSGQHMGTGLNTSSVTIGDAICKVLSVSNEEIRFQVPAVYNSGNYPIKLKVADKPVTSTENFLLEGPIIQSISPASGPAGTIVTISGSGFATEPNNNLVYFGDIPASITSATATQLKVIVPSHNTAEDKVVSVVKNQIKGISPTPFTLTGPVIISFTPTSGESGTRITINGSGFSTNPLENIVSINSLYYLYGTVISATANQLVVEVDPVYYSGNESQLVFPIQVQVKSITALSSSPFTFEGPSVTSISPSSQYEGRIITINGKNFDPDGNNRVFFSNYESRVIQSTSTSLTVEIPFGDQGLPARSQVVVSKKNYSYRLPDEYTILSPWQKLSDFPGGNRYGVSTFTIGQYSYVTMGIIDNTGDSKDVWRFNSTNNSWVKMADFPGQSRAFAFAFVIGGKAYVGGGGHYRYTSWDLISNLYDLWEYNPATDSWTRMQDFPSANISGKRFQATGIGQYGYFGVGNYFYRYDPSANQWTVSNSSSTFYDGGIAATIGGKGYFGLGVNYSLLLEFNPATNIWTQLSHSWISLQPGFGPLTSFVLKDQLYVGSHDQFASYNPQSDEWTDRPNIPVNLIYKGAFASGDNGYMITGLNGTPFPVFYSYDPNY